MQNLIGALNAYRVTPRVLFRLSRCCRDTFQSSDVSVPDYSLSNTTDFVRLAMSEIFCAVGGVIEMLTQRSNYQWLFPGENMKLLSVSKCLSYEKKIFTDRV
jgi:hypothetical protein